MGRRRAVRRPERLLVLLCLMVPLTAGAVAPAEGAATTGTVRVVAKYKDAEGNKHPLAGVEAWVTYDYGQIMYLCTDAKGAAVFEDWVPGFNLQAGMGVSLQEPRCDNAGYRNPDDGRRMLAVVYDGRHGVGPALGDTFQVQAGQVTKIVLVAKTPRLQAQVCGGLRATWVGTPDPDVFKGTPTTDVISGKRGNDVLSGLGGGDIICGGPGRDVLWGNAGSDILYGDNNGDRLRGGPSADVTVGGGGNDFCDGEKRFECEA